MIAHGTQLDQAFDLVVEQRHLPDEFLHDVKRLRTSSPAAGVTAPNCGTTLAPAGSSTRRCAWYWMAWLIASAFSRALRLA